MEYHQTLLNLPGQETGEKINTADQSLGSIIDFVRRYNRWRRGDDTIEMPNPIQIGKVLENLCDRAEKMGQELDNG